MAEKIDGNALLNKRKTDKSLSVFFAFVIVVLSLSLLFSLNYTFVPIAGSSMENTFDNGDAVLVSLNKEVERGDVIIIKGEKVEQINGKTVSCLIIKRVIAVGGDTVKFSDGDVYLKKSGETGFTRLKEAYVKEANSTFYPYADDPTCTDESEEIVIPEGEYFYLGDNRTNSRDSRTEEYSTCKESQIVGVVTERSIKNKQATKSLYDFTQKIYSFFYNLF